MNAIYERLERLAEIQAGDEVRRLLAPIEALEPNPGMTERLSALAEPIEKARREYTGLMIAWRKECLVRSISDKVLTDALNSFRPAPEVWAAQ